jgi:hypothetical protein
VTTAWSATRPFGPTAANAQNSKRSIPVPSQPTATGIEVLSMASGKHRNAKRLQAIHQIGAVIRSGEHWPRENGSTPTGVDASVQPLPHNPRKQWKNRPAAGWGERVCEGKWRRRWDSNPRYALAHAGFQDRCLRPLGHSSGLRLGYAGAGDSERRVLPPSPREKLRVLGFQTLGDAVVWRQNRRDGSRQRPHGEKRHRYSRAGIERGKSSR